MNEVLADIAKRVLSIESLETRKMDSLDFHDVAVWQVKKALEAAYRAGAASVATSTK
jgi:PIN domain nuclease of toxin-antitoxin system